MQTHVVRFTLSAFAIAACSNALGQVTQKPDGQWRALFTAGASLASGNSDAKSISLTGDAVKITAEDKWTLDAEGQYARSKGEQSANRVGGTARYARDITPRWFGFGQIELLHDVPAALSLRTALGTGAGYHLLAEPDDTWDVSAGLAYTVERYTRSLIIDDEERTSRRHVEALLAEESHHKLGESTSLKQKLSVYRGLDAGGGYRAVFDAGLSVAMTKQLALTASLSQRYDSQPGEGLGRSDTLFVTGLSWRVD